jgi:hypothetical protein
MRDHLLEAARVTELARKSGDRDPCVRDSGGGPDQHDVTLLERPGDYVIWTLAPDR